MSPNNAVRPPEPLTPGGLDPRRTAQSQPSERHTRVDALRTVPHHPHVRCPSARKSSPGMSNGASGRRGALTVSRRATSCATALGCTKGGGGPRPGRGVYAGGPVREPASSTVEPLGLLYALQRAVAWSQRVWSR